MTIKRFESVGQKCPALFSCRHAPHTAQAHQPWAASPASIQKPDTAPTWARHGQKKKPPSIWERPISPMLFLSFLSQCLEGRKCKKRKRNNVFLLLLAFRVTKGTKGQKGQKPSDAPHGAGSPALGSFPGLGPKARHGPDVGATRAKEKSRPRFGSGRRRMRHYRLRQRASAGSRTVSIWETRPSFS